MEMIGKQTSLAKINTTSKLIDVRRNIASNEEVVGKLNPIEKSIFYSSIKTSIAELTDIDLVTKLGVVANVIARDIGIKKIEEYDVTRFYEILRNYYSYMTLAEVKLAFEMSMTGELDDYLPKDRNGRADNNHYQTFNIAYITKILNAYKNKRNEVEGKVYKAIPVTVHVTDEQKRIYANHAASICFDKFLRYKYRNEYILTEIEELMIYRELDKAGLAIHCSINDSDRKEAVGILIRKAQKGLINQFVGECIRRQQTKHKDVDAEAMIIARRRALRLTFDYMVKEEIQIKI